ncbi:SDR family NAD(P)-dependent oxidoreductase [Aegicerativicinus sediminis]|uniref:SDR family NAD(P)-dependent oxidoreductase n=1 Tax=Aegicerativicinus sediminis TaxID=2893202 RepID=UPI001E3F0192|nr:SDR family oxidoreductase [Aegicerativicinus sediminis]
MSKSVIITGGNAGLGYATAKKFVSEGCKVHVIGRNKEKTENACKELGDLAIPYIFDLNELDEIPNLIEEISKHGSIDVLVNNAGINQKKVITEVTDKDFASIIHTNVASVFTVSREVIKNMKDNNGGSIVNISSMASQYGLPKVIAYSASKGAIESMTRAMAVEVAQYNIRVNCVAPGFIKTDMSSKALSDDPDRMNRVMMRTPMGKLGLPEDIAETVYYFSSPAAKFVTGTILPVDGGNSIGF